VGINDDIQRRAIAHAVYLERLKNGETQRLLDFYNRKVLPDLERKLAARKLATFQRGYESGPWTTKRYKDLIAGVKGTLAGGFKQMGGDFSKRLASIGMTEAEWAASSLTKALPLDVVTNMPSMATVRAMMNTHPMQGRLLKDAYKGLGQALTGKVDELLKVGLATGQTPAQLTAALFGKGRDLAGTGILGGVARRHVRTLVRTHTAAVLNGAKELAYIENQDVVKKVKWLSTLDANTTDICIGQDGQVYKLGQGPRPPAHMQCRSTVVPITKSWAELKKAGVLSRTPNARKLPKKMRASMNGQVPAKLKYKDWLEQEAAAGNDGLVMDVLGKKRYQLWKGGRLKIKQFWDDGRRLSLAELRSLEGLPAAPAAPASVEAPAAPAGKDLTPENMDGEQLRRYLNQKHGTDFPKLEKLRAELDRLTAELDDVYAEYKRSGHVGAFNKLFKEIGRVRPLYEEAAEAVAKSMRVDIAAGGNAAIKVHSLPNQVRLVKYKSVTISKQMQQKVDEAADFLRGLWRKKQTAQETAWVRVTPKEIHAMHPDDLADYLGASDQSAWGGRFLERLQRNQAYMRSAQSKLDDAIAAGGKDIEIQLYKRGLQRQIQTLEDIRMDVAATVRKIREAGAKVEAGTVEIEVAGIPKGKRAFEHKTTLEPQRIGRAHLASDDATRVYVHEMSHAVEEGFWVKDATRYRAWRARVEKVKGGHRLPGKKPINSLGETGWADEFIEGYFGRVYNFEATEITSMYTEYLYADPATLMRLDPHGFDFIVNLWRGVPLEKQAWFLRLSETDRLWVLAQ